MRKNNFGFSVLFGVLALMVACTPSATAMAGTHGKGDPKHPISVSSWPKGLDVVANRTDRIGGSWVNASDTFDYAGDAKAFNNFLQDYAKVQGVPLTLDIDGTPDWKGAVGPIGANSDWRLSVTGWSQAQVGLTLALGGRIKLKDLRVPININITFAGEKTTEVEKFLAAHKARQEKAKDARPGKSLDNRKGSEAVVALCGGNE